MIVYCMGMAASGSTWLYNIVKEIFRANGIPFVALSVEDFEQFADARLHRTKNVIMRGHNVSSHLLRFLEAAETKTILSFRDPRDCVASCLQRFGDSQKLVPASIHMSRNISSALSVSRALPNLTFHYEDGFTRTPASISACASFLGMNLSREQAEVIFNRHTPEAIRTLISNLEASQNDRFYVNERTNARMDRETSYHKKHFSDGRVGKWQAVLEPGVRSAVEGLFTGYAELLEKLRGSPTAPMIGLTVCSGSELCAPVDNMKDFRRNLATSEVCNSLGVQVLDYVYLPRGLWRFRFSANQVYGSTLLRVCQNGELLFQGKAGGIHEFEFVNTLHDHPFDFRLIYPGMADDVKKRRPPPFSTVTATFVGE